MWQKVIAAVLVVPVAVVAMAIAVIEDVGDQGYRHHRDSHPRRREPDPHHRGHFRIAC